MNQFLISYLREIVPVSFNVEIADELVPLGEAPPLFTVKVCKDLKKTELLNSTSLALGEAYIRGDIQVDHDLYEVLDTFLGEMTHFHKDKKALGKLLFTSKSIKNQEKEVSSHYDIGNDFYKLWLDETMSYSCGYFKKEEDSLYQAQVNKVDHILKKLQLQKGMTLLDIGCGWGFLLKRAIELYGVKCVGITLSKEQYKKVMEDCKKEGLEDYLEVRLMDYRDLTFSNLKFDRVVSVGMLEHVGRGNYELFFENVKSVLKPGGIFLLHYISALKEHSGDPFIKKYVFPGGVIPSLREIVQLMGDYNFYTVDIESLRRHYTKTLLLWRKNFLEKRGDIVEKYGEEFARMWELYLASCAATFHNGIIDLHQIVMTNGINNELAMVRKYD